MFLMDAARMRSKIACTLTLKGDSMTQITSLTLDCPERDWSRKLPKSKRGEMWKGQVDFCTLPSCTVARRSSYLTQS